MNVIGLAGPMMAKLMQSLPITPITTLKWSVGLSSQTKTLSFKVAVCKNISMWGGFTSDNLHLLLN